MIQPGRTGPQQHGAQQQMRAVPCLQPTDAAEHRLVVIRAAVRIILGALNLMRLRQLVVVDGVRGDNEVLIVEIQ